MTGANVSQARLGAVACAMPAESRQGGTRILMEARFAQLLTRTALVGCLLGVGGTVYLLSGLAGLVHSPVLNLAIVAVLVVGAAVFPVELLGGHLLQTNWVGRGIWLVILAILLTEGLLGLLPPTSRDELTHHLAIPKLYADAGRIVEVPLAPYAYYPMLVDMLYTPWIYWGYDFVPKWIHALYGVLTGLLIYAYLGWRMNAAVRFARRLFLFVDAGDPAAQPLGLYRSRHYFLHDRVAVVDAALARENRNALGALALAGLSLGFALATKPNGLVAALIIVMLFAMVLAKPPRQSLFASMQEAALFGALTLLPFLPWLAQELVANRQSILPVLARLVLFAREAATPSGRGKFPRHRYIRQARALIRRKYLADRRAAAAAVFFRPGR